MTKLILLPLVVSAHFSAPHVSVPHIAPRVTPRVSTPHISEPVAPNIVEEPTPLAPYHPWGWWWTWHRAPAPASECDAKNDKDCKR